MAAGILLRGGRMSTFNGLQKKSCLKVEAHRKSCFVVNEGNCRRGQQKRGEWKRGMLLAKVEKFEKPGRALVLEKKAPKRIGILVAAAAESSPVSASNISTLRGLSDEDLARSLEEAKRNLMNLRFKLATRQGVTGNELKTNKKQVAQIMTIKREREIENGVSVKESRYKKRLASKKTGIALKDAQRKRYQIPGKAGQSPNKKKFKRNAMAMKGSGRDKSVEES